jgi:peptidyl-prolyl cis-trans isomerase B (cyclophilin B)
MKQHITAKRILLARISGLVAAAIIVVLLVILNSRIARRAGIDRPPRHQHVHEHAAEAPAAGELAPEEKERIAAEYREKLAVIETERGTIKFELYPEDAPRTVENFANLARKGFYDGLSFHRVAKGALIQGGSPDGSPSGGPGYTIPAEFNTRMHVEGTVGMARAADPDSAGSQFYICLKQLPRLDGQYTVFGHVVEGMDVVRKIAQSETDSDDRPLEPIAMQDVRIEGSSN